MDRRSSPAGRSFMSESGIITPPPAKKAGLEGVVAVQSEICFIDGINGRLIYRGYDIADLVEHASFEEVCHLLWDGKLPNRSQLSSLKKQLGESAMLAPHVVAVLKALSPKTVPMDALRTAISAAAATDPDLHCDAKDTAAQRRKAIRLVAQLPVIVTAFHRLRNGQQPIAPDPGLSIAGNFLYMLLKCGDASTCEQAVRDKLARGDKIPGFGHRVYRTFDPRAHYLRKMSKQLGEAAGNLKWYEMSERLIPIMKDSLGSNGQPRNLNPNVDFFSASTYYTMGIPLELFTPLFAMARAAGWTAHVMEQHANNRIIRPTDDYRGPFDLKVTPIDQRP